MGYHAREAGGGSVSYAQAMRWHKKHPTGGKPQYMGFSTGAGFWPSVSWCENVGAPYSDACRAADVKPLRWDALYRLSLRGRIMCEMTTENRVEYTRIVRLRAIAEPDNDELAPFRP